MRILIACEESQAVTLELRKLGHEAFSCDLEPCSGGHPEWHIQGDTLAEAYSGKYDMMIAHPPCTFLAVSGARWMYHDEDRHLPYEERRPHPNHPNRRRQQEEGLEFVQMLMDAPIRQIAIENPVSVISTRIRKPDQIIEPYWFGDPHPKKTCLWLKNLPLLKATNMVEPEYIVAADGKKYSMIHYMSKGKSRKERQRMRSKTFLGIAKAMSRQWTEDSC